MATKTLTVVRPGRYGTRMLKAGDPLEVSGRDAMLYQKLGWATEGKPKAAKPAVAEETVAPKPRRRKKAAAKK